jgi:BTB/POZ domain
LVPIFARAAQCQWRARGNSGPYFEIVQQLTNAFRILMGGTFQFDVSDEADPFILHSKLVSRHSPVFDALMHNQMKESQEHRARLSNVDTDTFTRFAEFIYGGDYNAAEAGTVLDDVETEETREESESLSARQAYLLDSATEDAPPAEDAPPDEVPGLDSALSFGFTSKHNRGRKIRIRKQLQSLASLAAFPIPDKKDISFPKIDDATFKNDSELLYDYTEALCHVRLYAFAEQYQVQDLKNLVLHKLQKALKDTNFHPLHTDELADLVELAYKSTPNLSSREEPLRELLTHHVAWNFKALAPTKDFQRFLEAGGTWVNDICQKVCRRL